MMLMIIRLLRNKKFIVRKLSGNYEIFIMLSKIIHPSFHIDVNF